MISILIPVYNNRVYGLVHGLSNQLINSGIQGEIIVLDDASDPEYRKDNELIKELPFVLYDVLDKNYGRTLIRKELSSRSHFQWLLFIDGDSSIVGDTFLSNYLVILNKGSDVICGGRIYPVNKPIECHKVLHWKYGRIRESIHKNKTGFLSNNFCVRKDVFEKLILSDILHGYGHEDTLMGILFEKINARIIKIDNPVLHEGIEDADVFINKSENALINLLKLAEITNKDELKKHVKIYYWFTIIRSFHIGRIILFLNKLFCKDILKNLHTCNPSLLLFDISRIGKLLIYVRELRKTAL